MRQPRLEPPPLLRVFDVVIHRLLEPGPGHAGLIALCDPDAHPDHLRQSPVRDALSIGQAPAAVPPDRAGEPVGVLLELPGQPGLSDAGGPDDRYKVCLALLRTAVE